MKKEIANKLAGILFFVAFLPYIWAIVTGQTKPSLISWTIWASVDTLALIAMKKQKSVNGQIIGATAGAWFIVALSLVFGKLTMGSVEWVSVVGALAGIVLWKTTGNPTLAIICSQAAILLGAIPTFVSAYLRPQEENPIAWIIWLASCICALRAIRKWDIDNALQPVVFTIVEATVVFLVVVRPLFF